MSNEEAKLLRISIERLTTAINGLRADELVVKNDIRVIREKLDVIESRTRLSVAR